MTAIADDVRAYDASAGASTDELARLIWIATQCDPDDPEPGSSWPDLHAGERWKFERIAARVRTHLEQAEGWQRPRAWEARRWESAIDIPDRTRFRAVGDQREFVRHDEHVRAVAPPSDTRYLLGGLDAVFTRGYIEVVVSAR
ncbi:hypothetical protein NDR87_26185 [Nocardia sp. CDC159]|uniref:Uncharacterized protein n=1 Tax=Nocardia pulmonis TaxID=2951408 RepID=A0A9X2E798_9NOCA|nr:MULTISPECIES: hypothetical protein [Nocardia]MCM6774936.1 hypothetical protein [Nocardia pulmonis]MCM6789867.1 hypothetical protein [Nocardia sp. CDC159]